MNLRDFNKSIDWDAREAAAPQAPATLRQQAPLNRPAPESLLQQQQRAVQFKDKMREQWERDEQARISKLKHKHYATVNGKLVLVAGKPPTGKVGKYDGRAGSRRYYVTPFEMPWNDDGIVAYDA